MDFVFWIIIIVLIIGVVWWLLNRNNSSKGGSVPGRAEGGLSGGSAAASAEAAGTAGIPGAAGFGSPAEPAAPTTADEAPAASRPAEPRETPAGPATVGERAPAEPQAAEPTHGVEPQEAETNRRAVPDNVDAAGNGTATDHGPETDRGTATDEGEWETQWSEADGSPHAATHRPAARESSGAGATQWPVTPPATETPYVHHPEYTEPHSPTLPGAETAAAEAADEAGKTEPAQSGTRVAPAGTDASPAGTGLPDNGPETETADRARSSAAVETAASHVAEPSGAAVDREGAAEPAGHLAADQPYGAGSASPAQDGSGPVDFDVKGDAGTMVYYEEGHPEYEQIRADVWFESPAHAEAAGFRAPRRTRL